MLSTVKNIQRDAQRVSTSDAIVNFNLKLFEIQEKAKFQKISTLKEESKDFKNDFCSQSTFQES